MCAAPVVKECGRFAPSTTGEVHPGTLFSALLAWLDARAQGATFILRLEDLDPTRCKPKWADALRHDLTWFGLDWDHCVVQSTLEQQHEAALDRLQVHGLLYPCACTRARIRGLGRAAPDGGWAYDNACRARRLPPGGWRACDETLRVRMPDDDVIVIHDGSGENMVQCPARVMGDPVVRRRDGAVAYNLAVVVDDAAAGVTRVVRGRDIAPSTPTQVQLHRMLDLEPPRYHHHPLLVQRDGRKLAKRAETLVLSQLRHAYPTGAQLCAVLARIAGLWPEAATADADMMRVHPQQLIASFGWDHVRPDDYEIGWDGTRLL